jgi:hypothetical protein
MSPRTVDEPSGIVDSSRVFSSNIQRAYTRRAHSTGVLAMKDSNIRSAFLCTIFSSSGCSSPLVRWLMTARRVGDIRLV